MPKVTVAVPVYNVEKYLEKCARSVLSQTEKDIELLFIDDGSTDGSGALCDSIAKTDPRVRVIHQENRGLGGARNTGIENALGAWIIFPDSDDWLEPETVERALKAAESASADMAVFAFRSVDDSGNTLAEFREDLPENIPLYPGERGDLLLIATSACNKLYKTELFRRTGLRYPPRVWYEDTRTTVKLVPACRAIVYIDFMGYNYYQRPGSIMNSANLARNREIIDAFDDILSWYREQGLFEKYRRELMHMAVSHVYLSAAVRVLRQDPGHPLTEELLEYVEKTFPDFRRDPYISRLNRKQRIAISLLRRRRIKLLNLIFNMK